MKKQSMILAGAAFALGLAVAGGSQAADASLIEAAKKEGRVVWYTTQIVDQFVRPAQEAFKRKYSIEIDYVRSGTPDMVLRVTNEAKAGAGRGDIVDGTSTSAALKREGLLMQFTPPHDLQPAFVDKDRFWIANNLYVMTPGFNTSLVPKGTEPKTYEDLLDPRWKGKIAWTVPPANMLAPQFVGLVIAAMGEEKGKDYLRKLAAQGIVGHSVSGRQMLDLVIAGEFPLALQIFNNHTVISAARGAPSDWIPMEPALGLLSVASVTKFAPHPNAAKLLMEFLVSEEGQRLMAASGELPVHPRVPPNDPRLRPDSGNYRAVYFTPEELDAALPRWFEIFKDIFR